MWMERPPFRYSRLRLLTSNAVYAGSWQAWWIYFVAPPIGMLSALGLRRRLDRPVAACAKLHHDNDKRCIFCEYRAEAPR